MQNNNNSHPGPKPEENFFMGKMVILYEHRRDEFRMIAPSQRGGIHTLVI